jgi:hypothetical protein
MDDCHFSYTTKLKKNNPDWQPRARSQASKAKGGDIQQKDARVFIYFFNYVK